MWKWLDGCFIYLLFARDMFFSWHGFADWPCSMFHDLRLNRPYWGVHPSYIVSGYCHNRIIMMSPVIHRVSIGCELLLNWHAHPSRHHPNHCKTGKLCKYTCCLGSADLGAWIDHRLRSYWITLKYIHIYIYTVYTIILPKFSDAKTHKSTVRTFNLIV